MIDHISLEVSDYEKSKAFYQAALAPLGYELKLEFGAWGGFGTAEAEPDFWIRAGKVTTPGVHVAFSSRDRNKVEQFYQAALQSGGKDNGPPGIREIYHPHYYGAFILDPDGHNIEAVCHHPE